MAEAPTSHPSEPVEDGAPRRALSGGGSNTLAGSPQGGSRSGAEPHTGGASFEPEFGRSDRSEDERGATAGGTGEGRTAAQTAVTNTGEGPAPEDGVRRSDGDDDADAATG